MSRGSGKNTQHKHLKCDIKCNNNIITNKRTKWSSAREWVASGKIRPNAGQPTLARAAPNPRTSPRTRAAWRSGVRPCGKPRAMATSVEIAPLDGRNKIPKVSRNGCPACGNADTVPCDYSRWRNLDAASGARRACSTHYTATKVTSQ